jgi:hypothetical protein
MAKTKTKRAAEATDDEETQTQKSTAQAKSRKPQRKGQVNTYRLRENAGPHFEPNPDFDPEQPDSEDNPRATEYAAGQLVRSSRPLDQLFVNKFDVLSGGGNRGDFKGVGGDEHDPDHPDHERPVSSVEDAMVRRADRFLTEDELEGKPELQKLAKGRKVESDEKVTEKYGDEVTDDFDDAKNNDLRVFQDGDVYHVVDADDLHNPLTPKKGVKKAKVGDVISKYTQDEEDDEE